MYTSMEWISSTAEFRFPSVFCIVRKTGYSDDQVRDLQFIDLGFVQPGWFSPDHQTNRCFPHMGYSPCSCPGWCIYSCVVLLKVMIVLFVCIELRNIYFSKNKE